MKLFANTQGQDLMQHLQGVAKRSKELILNDFKYNGTSLLFNISNQEQLTLFVADIAYTAGLLHDLGKIDSNFQSFITKKQKNEETTTFGAEESRVLSKRQPWSEVYHNEISGMIIRRMLGSAQYPEVLNTLDYIAYWHHPKAFRKEDKHCENTDTYNHIFNLLDKFYDSTMEQEITNYTYILQQVMEYIPKSLCIQQYKTFQPLDKYNLSMSPKFFTDDLKDLNIQALNTLLLTTVIQADREVSALSPSQLNEFVTGTNNMLSKPTDSNWINSKIKPIPAADIRSMAQYKLSKEIVKNKFSVCAVDTGSGKTSVALLSKHNLKNNKKCTIILPKRSQVKSMYTSVAQDIERIFDNNKLTIQSIYAGEIQDTNTEVTTNMQSDINIVIYDRVIKSLYDRGQFNEFYSMLMGDLIVDEFHEFGGLDIMLPVLMTILKIRSWLDNDTRTILLSGTANSGLINVVMSNITYKKFERDTLPEFNPNKTLFKFEDWSSVDFSKEIDSLVNFNRIEEAQAQYIKTQDNSFLMHSAYTTADMKEKTTQLLTKFGTKSDSENIITAVMLQSSFNISKLHSYQTVHHPDTVCQFFGRNDRFASLNAAPTITIKSEDKMNIFNDDKIGFRTLISEYESLLQKVIGDGILLTKRQAAIELYDNFWTPKMIAIQTKELMKNIEASIKECSNIHPRRPFSINKGSKAGGSSLRGLSLYVSAKRVDDRGQQIGQLTGDDLLSEGMEYMIKGMRTAINSMIKSKLSKLSQYFEYEKINPKFNTKSLEMIGKYPGMPLLISFVDKEVDDRIVESLGEDHKVYNVRYGLIKSKLLIK